MTTGHPTIAGGRIAGGRIAGVESARVDQWLWAVRVFKTRAQATEACKGGHVRLNGAPAKAASRVRPGDRLGVHVHGRDLVLEVVDPIAKRVGAALAAACLVDHTPPAPAREEAPFTRTRGSGRPTKRERRQLDRFRT
jgi:ribosome-associated heat shock protein Hsp15